jgi:hypothetical protein
MIALSIANLITSILTQCKKHSQLIHVPLVSRKTEPQRPSINNLFLMLFFLYPLYPIPSLVAVPSSRVPQQPDAVSTRRGSSRAVPTFDLKQQRQPPSFHRRSKQRNKYLVSTRHSAIRIGQPLPPQGIIVDQVHTTAISAAIQHREHEPIR